MAESEYSIAIIGVAGRFPKADSVDEFWKNIQGGVNCITRNSELDGNSRVGAYGVLENIGEFDAGFFDISPREAIDSDPQGRIMLELTQHLLENSGCSSQKYEGKTGLYISFDIPVYIWNNIVRSGHDWYEKYELNRTNVGTRCEKIAYKFGFEGPAIMSEYACASSSYSIHQACQALLNYECDLALAGGITAEPEQKTYLASLNTMSNKGVSRPFDKNADGFVPGCAAALVALKRYDEAVAEHDNIIAVIRGTFVNNDGNRKAGFAAPSVYGQMNCLKGLLSITETDPSDIDYVEMHGTATELGDCIEARALKTVIGRRPEDNKVLIGSVKSNIGHTGMASGASNVIKAALTLRNRTLAPTINYEEPCDELNDNDCPLAVSTECRPFNKDKQLIAIASSVGMGGANVMALLAEYIPEDLRKPENRDVSQLLLISGKTADAAERIASDVRQLVGDKSVRLDDMAYTLQYGRDDFEYRTYMIAKGTDPDAVLTRRILKYKKGVPREIVFVFPGAGNFTSTAGRELYLTDRIFRERMNECFDIAESAGIHGMRDYFTGFDAEKIGEDNTKGIILIFSIGYSLALMLKEYGISPDAVMGHSNGEYIAAAVSGIITPLDAMKMLAARQEIIDTLPEGAMLNVTMSEDKVKELLIDGVEIGAVNAPGRTMVSGTKEAVDRFESLMREKNIICSRMKVNRAGHCSLMDGILEQYRDKINGIRFTDDVEIPIISTMIADPEGSAAEMSSPDYWVKQMRETVMFNKAITARNSVKKSLFIELGVSDMLTSMIRKMNPVSDAIPAFAVFDSPTSEDSRDGFLAFAGELWCNGININWEKLYDERPYKVKLTNYPFERKLYWSYCSDLGIASSIQEANSIDLITKAAEKNEGSKPANETETVLIGIVHEALGYVVSPEDNLYDYGMDSLMAMVISSKIRERFGLELKMSDMYGLTTVRAISDHLLSGKAGNLQSESIQDDTVPEKSIDDLFDEL